MGCVRAHARTTPAFIDQLRIRVGSTRPRRQRHGLDCIVCVCVRAAATTLVKGRLRAGARACLLCEFGCGQ